MSAPSMPPSFGPPDDGAEPQPKRSFGRFRLLRFAGKSRRSVAWQVHDPARGHDGLMLLARERPADGSRDEGWEQAVRRGMRLNHPHLADALEVDRCGRRPYVLYDLRGWRTLESRLSERPLGATIRAAVEATARWTRSNTNLGIVLLLAPVARAAARSQISDTILRSVSTGRWGPLSSRVATGTRATRSSPAARRTSGQVRRS